MLLSIQSGLCEKGCLLSWVSWYIMYSVQGGRGNFTTWWVWKNPRVALCFSVSPVPGRWGTGVRSEYHHALADSISWGKLWGTDGYTHDWILSNWTEPVGHSGISASPETSQRRLAKTLTGSEYGRGQEGTRWKGHPALLEDWWQLLLLKNVSTQERLRYKKLHGSTRKKHHFDRQCFRNAPE